jgi:uncharacterized cysteine cluster protein YcgN (CxxCxxCC family)
MIEESASISPATRALPFWKYKLLAEMTPEEWESLCDGCAKCCLHKFEDIDTGEIFYTNVACLLLDTFQCRCTDYPHRNERVPTCLLLTPQRAAELKWMPGTCAYRLLAEGKDLPVWHPLLSGESRSVHATGNSVRGKVLSELEINMNDLEEYVVDWFE